MITDRLLKEIVREINLQADDCLIIRNRPECGQVRKDYEHGKEIGLRRAISIIKKYHLQANPK